MALDEALMESVSGGISPPVLRLYRWSPATVTLGRFQTAERHVSLEACAGMGFDVVRRCTGGRSVLHDGEVTYAVLSPERSDLFPGGILENYRVIALVLQETLRFFGVDTELARERGGGMGGGVEGACFSAPSFAELVRDGCKMTGSAQRRQDGCFLQHGSIPIETDLQALARVFCTGGEAAVAETVDRLHKRVGWLNRWRCSPATVDEVERRLAEDFARLLGVFFLEGSPTEDEWERARVLEKEKYGNSAWTLQV